MNISMPLRIPQAFETGVLSIDAEHNHLINQLNECLETLYSSDGRKYRRAFHDFAKDLTAHFRHEESLMAEAEYPAARDHAKHHAYWLKEIHKMLAECEKRGHAEQNDVVIFFHKVLEDISKADIKFVEFLWCAEKMDDYRSR